MNKGFIRNIYLCNSFNINHGDLENSFLKIFTVKIYYYGKCTQIVNIIHANHDIYLDLIICW